jgi:hypothetical protein
MRTQMKKRQRKKEKKKRARMVAAKLKNEQYTGIKPGKKSGRMI